MTVSEMVAEIIERAADEIDNVPMDETEKLARKLAKIADERGTHAAAVDVTGADFTDAERALITPAIVERAERHMQAATEKSKAKAKKINDARRLPILPKREDGYYINAIDETPDRPEWGPYATKKEAEEERSSYLKNHKPPTANELAKVEAKEKARKSGTGAKKASEPKAAKTVTSQTEGNEIETTMKTKTKKKNAEPKAKAVAKAAATNGKPAKQPKAKKSEKEAGEKKLSALDAAYEVLKNRTVPMSAKDLIETMKERKLWESPGGKTPDATLAAALVREINSKGKDSRFTKPEAGKFAAK